MNSKEIVDYLKSEASEKHKENVIKMGIPEKFCIGVSTSTLRKFAKKSVFALIFAFLRLVFRVFGFCGRRRRNS